MHISHKGALRHWIQGGLYLRSVYKLCVRSNTQRHLFNIMPRLSPFHATDDPLSFFFIAAANVAARKGTKLAL